MPNYTRRRRGQHRDHTRPARRQYGPRAPQQRDENVVAEQNAMNQALEAILGEGNGPRLDPDGIRGSSTNGIQRMLAGIAQHHGFQGTPAEQMQQLQRFYSSPEGQEYLRANPQSVPSLMQSAEQLRQQRNGVGFGPAAPAAPAPAPDPAAPPRDPKAAGVLQPPAAPARLGLDGSLAQNTVLPADPVESQVAPPRSPQGLAPNS